MIKIAFSMLGRYGKLFLMSRKFYDFMIYT
jgi:hypothetical protein